MEERRIYDETERALILAGRRPEAKQRWSRRYFAAPPSQRAKMTVQGQS